MPRTFASQQAQVDYATDRASRIYYGAGSPEGVVTAPRGSMYLRDDGGAGTTLYIKEADDGAATGWAAK